MVLLLGLLWTGTMQAQDCECYAPTRQTAVRMMEKKDYAKALKLLRAAEKCPDKPDDNDLADKMQECRKEIQRQEDANRQLRERASKGWMDIKDIEFGNVDKKGNMLTSYGSIIYDKDLVFLQPKVLYEGLNEKEKEIVLYVKIINPDGSIKKDSSSPFGFTYSANYVIKPGKNYLLLKRWENIDRKSYVAGNYRFELYYNNNKIYEKKFKIHEKVYKRYDVNVIQLSYHLLGNYSISKVDKLNVEQMLSDAKKIGAEIKQCSRTNYIIYPINYYLQNYKNKYSHQITAVCFFYNDDNSYSFMYYIKASSGDEISIAKDMEKDFLSVGFIKDGKNYGADWSSCLVGYPSQSGLKVRVAIDAFSGNHIRLTVHPKK